MKAEDYRPIYDTDVTEKYLDPHVVGGWSKRDPAPISKEYCLMLPSARILASLFAGTRLRSPQIIMAPPIKQSGDSHFSSAFSRDVPWFLFTLDEDFEARRNAGQLAIYWGMPGVPFELALDYAVLDVQGEV